ncbi:MAG: ABC transporter substrate-binding protein [Polyangiales bacterium]|nr:ABC transporter substrate-binding protein [Myxococcales bacterium]MCB9658764.1 ABC transporter substrate-binding protein [Sandaracinaceae bacterium]
MDEVDDAFVVLVDRDVEQLDPRFVSDPNGLRVSRLLFASLVTIDPHTLEPIMDLAESVELESDTRYVVRLREGLRFSDGTPLDATDVVATFESVVDPALGARHAHAYRRITRVAARDARTVVFDLDAPHATFLTDLELPVLRSEDRARRVGDQGEAAPVGAGPYVLVERAPGRVTLRANPHWHGGEVRRERVRVVTVRDDNTRALRLRAGAASLAQGVVPPILLPLVEDEPAYELRRAPGIGTTYLGFHTEDPALRDVRVRRALAHATDREALVRAELEGYARVASSFIPEQHWASVSELAAYPYAPERARELLREAGFPDTADGTPRLRLTIRTGSDRARISIARAIAAMWREVGVELTVRPSETGTLIADLDRGRFQVCMLQLPEVIEPHVLSWFFGSDHIPRDGHPGANRWRFRSAALDEALERGRVHAERPMRQAAYRDVARVLASELPAFPLWHDDMVAVVRRSDPYRVPRDGRFSGLAR